MIVLSATGTILAHGDYHPGSDCEIARCPYTFTMAAVSSYGGQAAWYVPDEHVLAALVYAGVTLG